MPRLLPVVLALGTLLPAGPSNAAAANVPEIPCDRACLKGLADQLIDSMAADDSARLPLAPTYAATENSVPSALNMMVAWRTVTAAKQRFYVIDAVSAQVFIVASLSEGTNDTLLWGRVKAESGRLSEIELYENRSRGQGGYQYGAAGPANFPAEWTAPVPADRLLSRAALLAQGRSVFDSRQRALPASPDCVLMENGKIVAEIASVAAEVGGGKSPPGKASIPNADGTVPIPCGTPPRRPTDAKARTDIVDEVQGIVVSQAIVHGMGEPMIVTTPTESAFVPDQILTPYLGMLKSQRAARHYSAPALRPMAATASAAEVRRFYDGKLQGQLLLVNLGAPGSHSAWVP